MIRLLICWICFSSVHGWTGWMFGDKILLSDIDRVVGTRGLMTNARTSPPVPQLQCLGGCSGFQPDVVTCYNQGGSGLGVRWKCYAVMNPGYYFGRVDVNCEGYSYVGDPYVLANSCAIRYTLDYSYTASSRYAYAPSFGAAFAIFIVVCFLILICCLIAAHPTNMANRPVGGYPTYYDDFYYTTPRTQVVYVNRPLSHHTDEYMATTTSRGTNTGNYYSRSRMQSAAATSSSR